MESIIEIKDLRRKFGRVAALDGVSLNVPRAGVYGLVGENGAGKTTLLKHVLGMYRAEQGSVRVFGLDPVAHPVEVLGRIGYLSEDRDLPPWMRISDLLWYNQAFYPNWDPGYAEKLRETFRLDPNARVRTLSRGELAKAGLLVALAHRPDLLLLDEPSSGLDPVVRRDILAAIIRTVAGEGRTVVFSSHLLEEVERVADRVAMIHEGKLVLDEDMDALRETHHRLILRMTNGCAVPRDILGLLHVAGKGPEYTVLCRGERTALASDFRVVGAEILDVASPTLEEVFIAHSGASIEPAEL